MSVVSFAPMSAESISSHVRGKFNFSVNKFPLRGPDNMHTPFYGLFRSDTMEVVGQAVSARYAAHQTEDVLAIVDAAAKAFDGITDVRCHFNDGHYLILQPTRQHRLDVFGTKDSIFPRIMIRAGYDAMAFRATLGMYRDTCRNMMRLKTVKSATYAVRHVVGMQDQMDIMVKNFQQIGDSWDLVVEKVMQMESVKVNLRSLLEQLFGQPNAASQQSVSRHASRIDAIVARVMAERAIVGRDNSNGAVTGWEAYNGIQGYVQHEKTRRGNPNAFDRVILADLDPIVDEAESLILAAV